MSVRTYISFAVGLIVLAVLLGVAAVTVLSIPALNAHAKLALPFAFGVAVSLTPFVAWQLAPRLRLRFWQGRDSKYGD